MLAWLRKSNLAKGFGGWLRKESLAMSCKHEGGRCHLDAARHYERAAHHHREAARYFEAQDPVTAAQHALLATGHGHQGDKYATEAGKVYLRYHEK
jgi:hypothetical protein